MSVYYSTNLKNAPKMQKKKNPIKYQSIFPVYVCIKKLCSYHAFHPPTSFPPAIDRKGLLFLNAHYHPALLGRGKGESELGCKENDPASFEASVSFFPHYGKPSPSHPSLEILEGLSPPTLVLSLFSSVHAHLPAPPLLTLPLPGVKWGEFQSGVNVYSLLETLKNKNSS